MPLNALCNTSTTNASAIRRFTAVMNHCVLLVVNSPVRAVPYPTAATYVLQLWRKPNYQLLGASEVKVG